MLSSYLHSYFTYTPHPQSLKDWAQSGYPHSLVKPFVDVWRQEAHVEGRLGYRALVDATEAKRALEKWPYEGTSLLQVAWQSIAHTCP